MNARSLVGLSCSELSPVVISPLSSSVSVIIAFAATLHHISKLRTTELVHEMFKFLLYSRDHGFLFLLQVVQEKGSLILYKLHEYVLMQNLYSNHLVIHS